MSYKKDYFSLQKFKAFFWDFNPEFYKETYNDVKNLNAIELMKIFDVVLQMYSDFESIFTNVAGVDVFSKTNDDRILSVVGTFFKIDDDWILFNVVDVAHVEAEVFILTQNLN